MWQYPYVKDGIVFIRFGKINKLVHLALTEKRTEDLAHRNRIELLVHDLNEGFEYESHLFKDFNSDEAVAFLKMLKEFSSKI